MQGRGQTCRSHREWNWRALLTVSGALGRRQTTGAYVCGVREGCRCVLCCWETWVSADTMETPHMRFEVDAVPCGSHQQRVRRGSVN